MAIILEGGCRVSEMREGSPLELGTLRVWPRIGRAQGAQAISLRVLEFAPGLSAGLRNQECDEILYVLPWERRRAGLRAGQPLWGTGLVRVDARDEQLGN